MAKKWYRAIKPADAKRLESYILKNTTQNDINLGDLRYKIPAGKARNLLSRTANLCYEDIVKSVKSGSIKARMGNGLIEVYSAPSNPLPTREIANEEKVLFPQRIKSSIVIDMGEIDGELQDLTLDEDEEVLRQLEGDDFGETKSAPVVIGYDEE